MFTIDYWVIEKMVKFQTSIRFEYVIVLHDILKTHRYQCLIFNYQF